MKNLAYVLTVCLLLASISFSIDAIKITEIRDSKAYYELNNVQFDKKIINTKEIDLEYANEATIRLGLENKVSNNIIRDCRNRLVCDFIVSLTPTENLKLSLDDIEGLTTEGATLHEIFTLDTETYIEYKPINSYTEKEVCEEANLTSYCHNEPIIKQIGIEEIEKTRTVKTILTDSSYIYADAGTKTKVHFVYTKENGGLTVDLYPKIANVEVKEWALWGDDYTYSQILNVSWRVNATQGIADTQDLVPILLSIDLSNSTLYNTSNACGGGRFSNTADTVNYEFRIDSGCGTTDGKVYLFVSNFSNATQVKAWAGKLDATNANNFTIWTSVGIYERWDAESFNGELGNVRLDIKAGSVTANSTGGIAGGAWNVSTNAYFGNNTFNGNLSNTTSYFMSCWVSKNDTAILSSGIFGLGRQLNRGNLTGPIYDGNTDIMNYIGGSQDGPTIYGYGTNNSDLRYFATGADGGTYSIMVNGTYNSTSGLTTLGIGNWVYMGTWADPGFTKLASTGSAIIDECRLYFIQKNESYQRTEYGAFYTATTDWVAVAGATNTPTITPSIAYFNTTLNFNTTFNNLLSNNVTTINWTIYVNGSSYRVNQTTGQFANDSVSLWNESGFTSGSTIILQVESQLTNGTWINATNSSELTIINSNLSITEFNFTANGSSFTNGPVEANVTVEDIDTNDTITLFWNWFKNGVNQTAIADSASVTSQVPYNIDANQSPYTSGDNWSIRVWATDGTNTTPFNNSANTTIQALYTNLTINYTSPQFDLFGYNHLMNVTAQGATNLTANIYDGSTNASVQFTKIGDDYQFTILKYPAFVTVDSQQNYTWYLTQTTGSGSISENVSQYNVTVIPSGIYLCNATINTSTINYTIIDEQTGEQINATLNSIYTLERTDGLTKTTSITFTNDTIYACINPANLSISALVQEEALNATGYATRIYNQPEQTYSNVSIARTISLLNATEDFTQSVLISVLSKQELPLQGYRVRIEKYNLSSNSYFLTNSVVTDSNGQASISALIQTPKYNVTVYDTNENPVFNSPAVVFCQDGTLPCQYTIRIGEDAPWYYNNTGDTFDDSYGEQDFGNITVTGGKFCSFSNTTFNLNCTWNYTKAEAYAVQLVLTNGSANNKSIIASNYVSRISDPDGRASVNVPNLTGYYIYAFTTLYQSISNETALNYTKIVEIGSITINIPQNQHGLDGWFTTAILTIAIALALSFNKTAMIAGTGIVPLFMAIVGVISIEPITFSVILVVTIIGIMRTGE